MATERGSGADGLPLIKGTLDLLILGALRDGATHGYGVARWLEGRSDGSLNVEDSALYQSLRRLEGRGLVKAEWGVTENNRRARYYDLTAAGSRHLDTQSAVWLRYTRLVTAILGLEPGTGEPRISNPAPG